MMDGYLLVRVEGREYGIRIDQVVEVADGFELYDAPSSHTAVRGVTPMRDRLVPLVHLAALLANGTPAPEHCMTVVLARARGTLIALEVDDAEEVVSDPLQPVPEAWRLPWAAGVAERGDTMIPVIDIESLVERLTPAEVSR
ncbi:MAG: chemotaxis protein CheW [Gemmatimonadota bacterium]|nr:MAG: chemotaxis protein CheW [Gemmatimonadota bacterium]